MNNTPGGKEGASLGYLPLSASMSGLAVVPHDSPSTDKVPNDPRIVAFFTHALSVETGFANTIASPALRIAPDLTCACRVDEFDLGLQVSKSISCSLGVPVAGTHTTHNSSALIFGLIIFSA
ncbi:hypothetical protein GTZ97_03855 [Aquabacterium fontiphilum]|uniref:hypothetical protein n=1 Tax=Aquabacterium fontiphilum TaxID=450365 RepID=UPI00137786A2|nr:hypothetical protein [Aquabacterium fontiphilum]NBD19806.1 hypothetical protein [Aquabacterium fontiphilum]